MSLHIFPKWFELKTRRKKYNLGKVWIISLLGSITKMMATSPREAGEDLAFWLEKPWRKCGTLYSSFLCFFHSFSTHFQGFLPVGHGLLEARNQEIHGRRKVVVCHFLLLTPLETGKACLPQSEKQFPPCNCWRARSS